DVVYGVNNYINATGDDDFLYKYGAEIIFQTARFWLSRVEARRGHYEIRKVIGPDEFHEHIDNNAFTNYLVLWNLEYAVNLYNKMKKQAPEALANLVTKLKLKDDEIERMLVISKTIFFPYDQKTDLIEQFEGYFSLKDYKVTKHDKKGMPLLPKGVDESSLERTHLLKQADVVLLLYLFLDRFSPEVKKKNYKYYEARTMHKSSLSPCIYALMGLETGDHTTAYKYFLKTSYIDLIDANKNAADGIHAAATGGAWMTVVHGFAGMKVRRGKLTFNPWLPSRWTELGFSCFWRGSLFEVRISRSTISFQLKEGNAFSVKVGEKDVELSLDKPVKVRL
ncbi:MAG: glycoside hydrolase family 65 protein, partial [Candidatus Margulisbacteria bacterium]|nr:glycoside hydrolase family 65 protein [Candidatus Margulisiibacteriota bacterium]